MNAGVDISLRIGQRVRHQDYKGQRVTGLVTALSLNGRELMVDVALDEPIVFPADKYGPEVTMRHQHAPAHEYQPFDEREELIAELVGTLVAARAALRTVLDETPEGDEPKRSVIGARIRTISASIDKASSTAKGAAA